MDEKQSKSVLAAAKRINKKRKAGGDTAASATKKPKSAELSSEEFEAALILPDGNHSEEELLQTVLVANRAPVMLAFVVTLLRYTMPKQPVSARLSLGQALVSANSKSKAASIGLAEKGKSAEDLGWSQGQPKVRILSREIAVMRRHTGMERSTQPALWGLDLEGLQRKGRTDAGLPIYQPHSARNYLLNAFVEKSEKTSNKKENLGKLLQAIDMLCRSWSSVLSSDDLDRRAWAWYTSVRPEVKAGVEGWGNKGEISIKRLLDLRHTSS